MGEQSAAGRFFGIAEIRASMLDNVDIDSLARLARCSKTCLIDVVPRLYHHYPFNALLKRRPTLGLTERVDIPGPRDELYLSAVRTLTMETLVREGAAFAQLIRVNSKRSEDGVTGSLGLCEADGSLSESRMDYDAEILVNQLRHIFPCMQELRLFEDIRRDKGHSLQRPFGRVVLIEPATPSSPMAGRIFSICEGNCARDSLRFGLASFGKLSSHNVTPMSIARNALRTPWTLSIADLVVIGKRKAWSESPITQLDLRLCEPDWGLETVSEVLRHCHDVCSDDVALQMLFVLCIKPYTRNELAALLSSQALANSALVSLYLCMASRTRDCILDDCMTLIALLEHTTRLPRTMEILWVDGIRADVDRYDRTSASQPSPTLDHIHLDLVGQPSHGFYLNQAMTISNFVRADAKIRIYTRTTSPGRDYSSYVTQLTEAIRFDPNLLDGLDFRQLGLTSEDAVEDFVELGEDEIRRRVSAVRAGM